MLKLANNPSPDHTTDLVDVLAQLGVWLCIFRSFVFGSFLCSLYKLPLTKSAIYSQRHGVEH